MTTLILWHASRAFSQKLETDIQENADSLKRSNQEKKQRWVEISKDFQSLKKLARMINLAIGHSVTFFAALTFLSYALNLDTILRELRNPKWDKVAQLTLYFSWDFLLFMLAADVCRNVSTINLITGTLGLRKFMSKFIMIQVGKFKDWLRVADHRKEVIDSDELLIILD